MDKEKEDRELRATMAKKVLAVRKRLGLTQEQFAKLVQVKPNTIASWEQARTKIGKDNIKVIEDIEEMTHDEEFVRVVQKSLGEKDGIEAVAVLIGLIMGLTKVTKLRYDMAKNMLWPGSTYLKAVNAYLDRAEMNP
jgi:transcriptional regulator with XRE-family HTH domain